MRPLYFLFRCPKPSTPRSSALRNQRSSGECDRTPHSSGTECSEPHHHEATTFTLSVISGKPSSRGDRPCLLVNRTDRAAKGHRMSAFFWINLDVAPAAAYDSSTVPGKTTCPRCGEVGCVRVEHVIQGGKSYRSVECLSCGHQWRDLETGGTSASADQNGARPERSR